jgi:hypothetical protein
MTWARRGVAELEGKQQPDIGEHSQTGDAVSRWARRERTRKISPELFSTMMKSRFGGGGRDQPLTIHGPG